MLILPPNIEIREPFERLKNTTIKLICLSNDLGSAVIDTMGNIFVVGGHFVFSNATHFLIPSGCWEKLRIDDSLLINSFHGHFHFIGKSTRKGWNEWLFGTINNAHTNTSSTATIDTSTKTNKTAWLFCRTQTQLRLSKLSIIK